MGMKLPKSWPLKALLYITLAVLVFFLAFMIYISLSDFRPPDKENLEIKDAPAESVGGKRVFTISTWNLGYFGLGSGMNFFYDGGKRVRPGRQEFENYLQGGLDYINRLESDDFIFFQEVDRNSRRSYHTDELQEIMENLPYHDVVFAVNYKVGFVPAPWNNPMGKVLSGMAVFSMYKPDESYRITLPGSYAWPLKLFMLDRCFILSRFHLEYGYDLVLINTHNEAFDNGQARSLQMEHIRMKLLDEYQKGNYVVAGGDWNMNPVGFENIKFENGDVTRKKLPAIDSTFLPKGWNWVFDPSVPTNRDVDRNYQRGITPATVIDFFITSPNICVDTVITTDLGFRWSDHQPVTMWFQILTP